MVLKSIFSPPKKMSSDDETIACMEAALKKVKADKIAKAEQRVAEECRIAKEKAVEERCIAEAKVQEEERSRAQVEALRQQKLLDALEVKRKAGEVASGSESGPKGGLKNVGASEKGM